MPRSGVGRHSSDATASSSERVEQTTPSSCFRDPHQSPTCQTNHTTTSPEPHQIHQTNSTRYLRPQPAQPPSPPRKKNGSPTQRGNGRSHYNSLSCFSQWSSYHTWANTLAARPHTGDGPNTWSGNTLCISRSQILVSSRASVPSKPPPPCETREHIRYDETQTEERVSRSRWLQHNVCWPRSHQPTYCYTSQTPSSTTAISITACSHAYCTYEASGLWLQVSQDGARDWDEKPHPATKKTCR